MTWSSLGDNGYEAYGPSGLYILRRHVVQEEAGLRTALTTYCQQHGLPPHPYQALTTAELLCVLKACEEEDDA